MYELQANTHAEYMTKLEHQTLAVINKYYLTVIEVRVLKQQMTAPKVRIFPL